MTPDLIIDVEATCWDNGKSWYENRSEVIEFGCYVPQATGLRSAAASFMVKPTFHPILSEFCTELTSITQAMIDEARPLHEMVDEFRGWVQFSTGKDLESVVWASWGFYDLSIIKANAAWLGVPLLSDTSHVNLKELARRISRERNGNYRVHQEPQRKGQGLQKALAFFGLAPFDGTPHRGIDDARNIGRIWEHIKPFFSDDDIRRHAECSKVECDRMMKKALLP